MDVLVDENADQKLFFSLSIILTGLEPNEFPAHAQLGTPTGAKINLHEIYFARIQKSYGDEFAELLSVWRVIGDGTNPESTLAARLAQTNDEGTRLRRVARQVVKIWYLSTIDDPLQPLDPSKKGLNAGQLSGGLGQYQHSAIWPIIGASAPGYSHDQHGFWAFKPS